MKRTLHDLASLAARMGVGGIFFANGWQKLEAGLNATADQFTTLQAPLPHVWAPVTMLTELVGGTLLIAGLAVPIVGLLLFAEALAVFVLTAGDAGLPLTGGDIELIVALGAASVLLAVTGAGRISADHMVVIKRREAEAAGEFAAAFDRPDAGRAARADARADAEADAVIAALRPPRPGEPGADGAQGRPTAPAGPAPSSGERRPSPGSEPPPAA
ncbi:DoxX family protein, partial [Microbispora sp. NPDC049633]|uniref:DoxX family protein n=1 Tax=Microbispora sp. NPDC049633 TaxID=3154355 RepID=UPI0034206EA1